MTSKRVLLAAVMIFVTTGAVFGQSISGVSPSSPVNVRAGDDWATLSYQDPMDMTKNTDLGWHLWSIDQPASGLSNIGFNQANANGSGLFHGVSSNAAPNFYLLESSNRFSAKLGRTGDNFPVDATKYKLLSMRMCQSGSGVNVPGGSVNGNSTAFVVWSPNDADQGGLTAAGAYLTYAGCYIYTFNLTAAPNYINVDGGGVVTSWTGLLHSLRFDPTHLANVTIDVDWIRLVSPSPSAQTFTWSGGNADLYLYTSGGTPLGMLYKDGALARSVASGYKFDMGALAGGSYYVQICPAFTPAGSASCKNTATFNVNGIPTVTVTAPTTEGSTDDFATVQLNNAWDFNSLTDIDFPQNIQNLRIDPAFPVQAPDGTDLGTVRALRGNSIAAPAAGWGDPNFYTLWFSPPGRGATKQIDTNRYRIATIDMGLAGPRDIVNGSISRIIWKVQGETAENVSQDILINHRAGVNILNTISVDMKQLLLETGGGMSTTGWNGMIDNFRFDPHEFTPATDFWVKRIKLAAFETVGAAMTYTIKWNANDAFDNGSATGAKVTAYYQQANPNGIGATGALTAINTCAAVAAATGQCTWNTGNVIAHLYYVYLVIDDGVNSNAAYSKYPILVDNASVPKPRIVLDRSQLNFGGTNNGKTVSPPQPVKLSVVGSGTVNWTATSTGSAANLFCVSPTSGQGPATITVSICSNAIDNRVVGQLGTVVVSSAEADNSPQAFSVYLTMAAATGNPYGGIDTPADGAMLQGSVAITGWALDDLGITKIQILRDANAGDPPGAVFAGKVFVGDATLVDGARPDIVSAFPSAPANYNAGFGYLMLTRGVIWEGKGPFKIYAQATDVEGHVVILGSKTVSIDNSTAYKPFGAIDTPGQGGTASGNYPNTGWVLSPAGQVPANGVLVAVDGVFLPNTFSMSDRSDITSTNFPGFVTTNSGRGSFIDTTQFADGVHTIGWLVTDSVGNADGVGSRFFKTANGVSNLLSSNAARPVTMAGATTTFARLGEEVEKIRAPRSALPVSFATGMNPAPVLRRAAAGFGGSDVRIREMERLVVNVGDAVKDATYTAYRVVDGKLQYLPVGASFDVTKGVFYWQPAPGFVGDYDFVFVRNLRGSDVSQVSVRVTVGPSTATLRAGLFRGYSDTAAAAAPDGR